MDSFYVSILMNGGFTILLVVILGPVWGLASETVTLSVGFNLCFLKIIVRSLNPRSNTYETAHGFP